MLTTVLRAITKTISRRNDLKYIPPTKNYSTTLIMGHCTTAKKKYSIPSFKYSEILLKQNWRNPMSKSQKETNPACRFKVDESDKHFVAFALFLYYSCFIDECIRQRMMISLDAIKNNTVGQFQVNDMVETRPFPVPASNFSANNVHENIVGK